MRKDGIGTWVEILVVLISWFVDVLFVNRFVDLSRWKQDSSAGHIVLNWNLSYLFGDPTALDFVCCSFGDRFLNVIRFHLTKTGDDYLVFNQKYINDPIIISIKQNKRQCPLKFKRTIPVLAKLCWSRWAGNNSFWYTSIREFKWVYY